jgi:hypothetical protein
MKNKARNIQNMPALGDGWAHFIPETPYMEHVRQWGFEEQVRFLHSNIFWSDHRCSYSAINVILNFVL